VKGECEVELGKGVDAVRGGLDDRVVDEGDVADGVSLDRVC